jgi:hypothetical protein
MSIRGGMAKNMFQWPPQEEEEKEDNEERESILILLWELDTGISNYYEN